MRLLSTKVGVYLMGRCLAPARPWSGNPGELPLLAAMPGRQKSAPASSLSQRRVSASLPSRDAGEGRASLGNPG